MKEIRFSHDYPKLWGQEYARLIEIELIDAGGLSPDLIEYDTKTSDGDYYQLPKSGKLMQLIFLGNKGIPFCTLRTYSLEKFQYYSANKVLATQFRIVKGSA